MAKADREQIVETLKRVPLFQAFREKEDDLALLAAVMTTRTVRSGSLVVEEGQIGEELFILQRGEVEITKTTLQDEQYTVAVLGDEAHPFFGELALVDADKRSATIRALKPCEVLVLKRKDFEKLGNDHPHLGLSIMRNLAKIISRRFRDTNDDVVLLFEALVKEVSQKTID